MIKRQLIAVGTAAAFPLLAAAAMTAVTAAVAHAVITNTVIHHGQTRR